MNKKNFVLIGVLITILSMGLILKYSNKLKNDDNKINEENQLVEEKSQLTREEQEVVDALTGYIPAYHTDTKQTESDLTLNDLLKYTMNVIGPDYKSTDESDNELECIYYTNLNEKKCYVKSDSFKEGDNVAFKEGKIKEKFNQLFDTSYAILSSIDTNYGTCEYENGTYFCQLHNYNSIYETSDFSEFYKVEQVGDEIYIWERYIYMEVDSIDDTFQLYKYNSHTVDNNVLLSEQIYKFYDYFDDENGLDVDYRKKIAFQLAGDYTGVYKHTYKKNQDGNYYWYSTEPEDYEVKNEVVEDDFNNVEIKNDVSTDFLLKFIHSGQYFYSLYDEKKVTIEDIPLDIIFGKTVDLLGYENADASMKGDVADQEKENCYWHYEICYLKNYNNSVNDGWVAYEPSTIKYGFKRFFNTNVYAKVSNFEINPRAGCLYSNNIYFCSSGGGMNGLGDGEKVKFYKREEEANAIYLYEKYINTIANYEKNEIKVYKDKTLNSFATNEIFEYDDYRYEQSGTYINRIDELIDLLGDKVPIYKHTFKKSNEGYYYWYSTEPVNN